MQAIYSLIKKFVESGVLEEVGTSKHNKQYKFTELVNVAEGIPGRY